MKECCLYRSESAAKAIECPLLAASTRLSRTLKARVSSLSTIDWTMRENVRAHLRVLVKRMLRKYGYPPDVQEKATLTVLEQAEVLSTNWPVA